MSRNIIVGAIGAIIAGVILFFVLEVLDYPPSITDQLHELDLRLTKSEGQLKTFITLRKEFDALQNRVTTVQSELKEVTAFVITTTGDFSFIEPRPGTIVPRYFKVRGEVTRPPREGHLWLAVEFGNLAWPKEPELKIVRSNWYGEVYVSGSPPEGRFKLSLWLVNDEGHQKILDWLDQGHKTGNYPGLPGLPGALRLSEIELQLQF